MTDRRRVVGGMLMLTVLGLIMLVPPVVMLFNHDTALMGMPQIVVYLFAVWILLIAGTIILNRWLPTDEAEFKDEGDD